MNKQLPTKIIQTRNIKLKIKYQFLLQKIRERDAVKEILNTIPQENIF